MSQTATGESLFESQQEGHEQMPNSLGMKLS